MPRSFTYFIFFFCFLFLSVASYSQGVKGVITDGEGEPLSFVDIYIYDGQKGTISNEIGEYIFDLDPGQYHIIFNYVGYAKQTEIVNVPSDGFVELNVQMKYQALDLNEIVVTADREDPAYEIIRKAREKRKSYSRDYDNFECKAYTKQKVKIIHAPDKFLGQELGNLEGILDSVSRNGIIYLSEGVSVIYQDPEKGKFERVISSKVSGDAGGYTWNSAKDVSLNPYQIDYHTVGRNLLSPIAPDCMNYYDYKLVGTFYDGDTEVNKIQLLPKRQNDPVFSGFIYIIEGSWRIYAVEFVTYRSNHRTEIIDTVEVRQTMLKTANDTWVPYTVTIEFGVNFLGVKFDADMVAFFSDYKFGEKAKNPNFSDNVILEVESFSNQADSNYWNEIRPIPLVEEEIDDYKLKDSLQAMWLDTTRIDSLDREFNKVDIMDVIFAYKHKNSHTNTLWRIRSPITNFSFDPVQGFFIKLESKYRKGRSQVSKKQYELHPKVLYGFADEKWRWSFDGKYYLSHREDDYFRFNVQNDLDQVNPKRPVSRDLNILASLFTKVSAIRWFNKEAIEGGIAHRLSKDLIMDVGFSHQRRTPVQNNSNFSFFFRDSLYAPNEIEYEGEIVQIDTTVVNVGGLELTYFPGTKLFIRPGNIQYQQEKYLKLYMRLLHDFGSKNTRSTFTKLVMNVTQQIHFPIAGTSEPSLEFGTYINRVDDLNFLDYYHFETNNFQLLTAGNYRGFLMMPHFIYSTPGYYVKGDFNHNFEGFIVDKIPLLNKLRIKENVGLRGVYLHHQNDVYWEWNVGIHRFGWRYLKFIRIDYAQSYYGGKKMDGKVLLGVDFRF